MPSARANLRAARMMPAGVRPTLPPQGANAPYIGQFSPVARELANETNYRNLYGPFLPRPPRTFTQGAFGPFSPILPVPVDEPAAGAEMPDPRRWQFPVGYNLPVGEPGSEGFKLAPFATLKSLAELYSVARTCIQRRKFEIAGLDWDITPTREAAKAYQGDHKAMADFGERRAQAIRFFRRPDPDYFDFSHFLSALLEEIFVYDALCVLLRPKRGRGLGKGLLGSDLDCLELISGPTIRPLLDLHGGHPRPPAPAYQQYLYGVPRSDYLEMWDERDIEEAGLRGSEWAAFSLDQMLYLPLVPRRESPYGFGPTEQALIAIMTGLRKQAFQLSFFDETTVPSVYISPGNVDMTPTQIRELQDALNGTVQDPAWRFKVVVLPPGSKVEPQKPVDLADQFDEIIMTEVAMCYDVNPMDLGILPKVSTVASPFAAREMAQASRTVHERTSTKPLLKFLCGIFTGVLHRVAGQDDMQFTFDGMQAVQDQSATTDMLVKQAQNGIRSIDEAREVLELPPWGLPETSNPVVFTQMGPIPLESVSAMVTMRPGANPEAALAGLTQGAPALAPGTGKPAGQHHAPSSRPVGTHNPRASLPHSAPATGGRPGPTPAHAAAQAHVRQPSVRPGGRPNARAAKAEMEALARHLRKGRAISTWEPVHLPARALSVIAEDIAKGMLIDQAVARASAITLPAAGYEWVDKADDAGPKEWPGWLRDLELIAVYAGRVSQAFTKALRQAGALIRQWWSGILTVTRDGLVAMISALVRKALARVLRKLWRESWHLGQRAARAVATGTEPDWGGWKPGDGRTIGVAYPEALKAFIATHGASVLAEISSTRMDDLAAAIADAVKAHDGPDALIAGLAAILRAEMRAEMIAATEAEFAISAAAVHEYRHHPIALKQWVTAHDGKVCAICAANAAEGPVPLDALFASGTAMPPQHPRCRCALIGVPVITKAAREDPSRAAFLMLRAPDDDGKWRYLLQKRSKDSTWGLPGGKTHVGEDLWDAALREATEEMGDLPAVTRALTLHRTEDDGREVWTFLAELPAMFTPSADGKTAEETIGWGWFRRKEIGDLPLNDGMAETWQRLDDGTAIKNARVVQLNGQETWMQDGSPRHAAGGGGRVLVPHDADGRQEYIPGGVPGSTAGGEPPRWDGGDVPHVLPGEPVASDGRAGGSAGGGTAGRYTDFSERTHASHPEDADDADWPRQRGIPAPPGGPWPAHYMDGYWPSGGHGTAQAPASPIGDGPRGRAPNAVGKEARGYDLNPRSGMISLDLPDGLIEPVSGGVSDHHVTVVYLGPDVDDEAWENARERARQAAAKMPGPLTGTIGGIGSFEPSASSDGKVPVWAGVMLPGADLLRRELEDLSASEHANWHPHVTLAYLDEGDPMPAPLPHTPVAFRYLTVHRGGDLERFLLGPGEPQITKGASDYSDPNPVDPLHVYNLMRENFPAKALKWVLKSTWVGPVNIPWERVNTSDEDEWAASHQPGAVDRFAREIEAGQDVPPSILMQRPDDDKADVIDGHHRALSRHKLGKPVLAYLAFVPQKYVQAALETHSYQIHSGADPANKRAKVSKASVHYRGGSPARHCGNCSMYDAHTCTLVRGWIEADDVCDEWEPRDAGK